LSVGHYENFPVASLLLPPHYRRAVVAIYRFARAADDIADEGSAAPLERHVALARFARGLDAIERGETPQEPPFTELAHAVRAHALPMGMFRDLLSAFAQDVDVIRYATFADVLDYCRRSANPIGRLLLALYKVGDPESGAQSDAICTALQLANFWQDVAIDWRKGGRMYLPLDDLARFDVPLSHVAGGVCDARWTRLMAFEDYGMRLEVRFWIADPMNGVNNVRSDVNRAIWRLFKDNGVKIPVAQRELRILEPSARFIKPPQKTGVDQDDD